MKASQLPLRPSERAAQAKDPPPPPPTPRPAGPSDPLPERPRCPTDHCDGYFHYSADPCDVNTRKGRQAWHCPRLSADLRARR